MKLSPLSKVVGKRKPKLDLSSLNHTMGSETNSLSGAPGTVNGSSGVGGGGGANFSSSVLDDFSALDMLFLDLEVRTETGFVFKRHVYHVYNTTDSNCRKLCRWKLRLFCFPFESFSAMLNIVNLFFLF